MSPEIRLAALNRPRLLVRAARIGSNDFSRERMLARIFPGEAIPPHGQAFDRLFLREAEMDQHRRDAVAGYSPARHVEILSALIFEARIAELRCAA